MNITDAFYSFLASKEADDIGFAKFVRNQPRKQLLKTNVLKTNVRNTQKRLMKN